MHCHFGGDWLRSVTVLAALVALALPQWGCVPSASSPTAHESDANETVEAVAVADDGAATANLVGRETWDAVFLQGAKVGHTRTRWSRHEENGRELVRIEGTSHLALSRFGQPNDQDIQITSIETPDGRLVRFETTMQMGPAPVKHVGRVEGNEVVVETTANGASQAQRIPWSAADRGFFAIEQSLAAKPIQPGQTLTLRSLMPVFMIVATIELEALDYEATELLDGSRELLRITSTTMLPDGSRLDEFLWTDRQGHVVKTRVDPMDLESFRTDRETALAEPEAGRFDLGAASMVEVARPLGDAHRLRRVRYRVRLDQGDPAEVFVPGPHVEIQPIDDHSAELTVTSAGLGPDFPFTRVDDAEPVAADGEPNRLIESDVPRIVEMAREAAGSLDDPLQQALALEAYVDRTVTAKNFSQVFASAAEVAETREGDCTEHAVLLAALARALGLPARVAIGLVYVEPAQAFGYHMWTEVYVDGRWTPLDATLAQGGIGPTHLKLAHSNLEGASAYSAFLPVVRVLGQLHIDVLDYE